MVNEAISGPPSGSVLSTIFANTAEKAYHFYTRFTVASSFQVIQATKHYVAQYLLKLASTSEKSLILIASGKFHTVLSRC